MVLDLGNNSVLIISSSRRSIIQSCLIQSRLGQIFPISKKQTTSIHKISEERVFDCFWVVLKFQIPPKRFIQQEIETVNQKKKRKKGDGDRLPHGQRQGGHLSCEEVCRTSLFFTVHLSCFPRLLTGNIKPSAFVPNLMFYRCKPIGGVLKALFFTRKWQVEDMI